MAIAFDLPPIRIALYTLLTLFSIVVFGLSIARVVYTKGLSPWDPLNHGQPYYDPIVAELIVSTILTVPWCLFVIITIHKRIERRYGSSFRTELFGLFILWIFWLCGAAIATVTTNRGTPGKWGDLSFCWEYQQCRILTTLLAFAWSSWAILTFLLVISIIFVTANRALLEPMHGRWDPRASHYGPGMPQPQMGYA
ncbi:hypothetical protein HDZ31DRAFT_40050 [Schizophyllum fasciatum]